MNDHTIIKKIFRLAYYDFTTHASSWIFMTGWHAILFMIVFLSACSFTNDFEVTSWAWLFNMTFDVIIRGFTPLFYEPTMQAGRVTVSMVSLLMFIACSSMKNSLDLAFDSAMSGLLITDIGIKTFSRYVLMFIVGHCLVAASGIGMIVGIAYFLRPEYAMSRLIFQWSVYLMCAFVLYGMLLVYILAMHSIEYKKSIAVSIYEFLNMIHHKLLFLLKIMVIQFSIILGALFVLYFCFGKIATLLVDVLLWFTQLFHLPFNYIFVSMLYNFFYLWAYILLYSWICLVIAHVYRQLVCPPVENISCSSCDDC